MITKALKAKAIAMLEENIAPEVISHNLDINVEIIKDWKQELDPKSLVTIEATVRAIDQITSNGQVLNPGLENIVKQKLEQTAHEIADQIYSTTGNSDIVLAKALQLNADAVSKLYQTIILKGSAQVAINPNPTGRTSAFSELASD